MPRTEEANQRIREAQRSKILDAAWKVFARKGRTLVMADVAAAADVSYGLVYRYFVSKEAILFALMERSLQNSGAALQHYAEMSGTPGERLESLITRLVEERHRQPEYAQLFDHVMTDEATPADLRDMFNTHAQVFEDMLRQLIVAGQVTGEVLSGDPDQLMTAIMAALDGLIRLTITHPERVQNHYPDVSIILRMIKAETR